MVGEKRQCRRINEMLDAYSHQSRDADVTWQDHFLLDRFVSRKTKRRRTLVGSTRTDGPGHGTRRLVGNSQDADDVFQAVFMSLAQLPKTIRKANTLPAWLHKATCRVAVCGYVTAAGCTGRQHFVPRADRF